MFQRVNELNHKAAFLFRCVRVNVSIDVATSHTRTHQNKFQQMNHFDLVEFMDALVCNVRDITDRHVRDLADRVKMGADWSYGELVDTTLRVAPPGPVEMAAIKKWLKDGGVDRMAPPPPRTEVVSERTQRRRVHLTGHQKRKKKREQRAERDRQDMMYKEHPFPSDSDCSMPVGICTSDDETDVDSPSLCLSSGDGDSERDFSVCNARACDARAVMY